MRYALALLVLVGCSEAGQVPAVDAGGDGGVLIVSALVGEWNKTATPDMPYTDGIGEPCVRQSFAVSFADTGAYGQTATWVCGSNAPTVQRDTGTWRPEADGSITVVVGASLRLHPSLSGGMLTLDELGSFTRK